MFIALIIVVGLVPAAVSLFVCLRFAQEDTSPRRQFQRNIDLASDYVDRDRLRRLSIQARDPDEHYVDGIGLVIGDITCQLNARSPYIRCAPNPSGPCEGCREYEGKEYPDIDFKS